MSGMMFFCWASSWMCSLITSSNLIKVQRHGFSSAIFDHLFSSFCARASSWRVPRVVLLKRHYLRPCVLVISQYVLGCSSAVPPRRWTTPGKLLLFPFLTPICSGISASCRSGLPNVPLSVFLCLEVHERSVTRQTCLAEVL